MSVESDLKKEGIEIIKKLSVFIKNTDNTDLEEKKEASNEAS